MLRRFTGDKLKLTNSSLLKKSCRVCKCSIPFISSLNMDNQHEDSDTQQAMRPDSCWLKVNGPNYKTND